MAANPLGEPERASGRRLQPLALHLLEQRHVDIAVVLLPALVLFDSQRSHEPQAARLVREDPEDFVRRLISSLNRSSMFVDFMFL